VNNTVLLTLPIMITKAFVSAPEHALCDHGEAAP